MEGKTTLCVTDREVARRYRVFRERNGYRTNAEALADLLENAGE